MYISVFSAAFDPSKSRRRLDEKKSRLIFVKSFTGNGLNLRSKFFEIRTTLKFSAQNAQPKNPGIQPSYATMIKNRRQLLKFSVFFSKFRHHEHQ